MRRLAILLLILVVPATAHGQELLVEAGTADCSTPRRALETWLNNLQPDALHPRQAARCFDWGAVRIHEHARQDDLVIRFKHVLDGRGLYVEMDDISDETELEGENQVTPFPNRLERFYLIRKGETWVISADTIRSISRWHEETEAFNVDEVLDELPAWLRSRTLGMAWWQLFALALLVLISFVIRFLVASAVETQGTLLLTRLVTQLDAKLLRKVARPVGTVVMMVLLIYSLPTLRLGVDINRLFIFALHVAAAVSGVLIVYRLVDVGSDVMAKRALETETKLDDQLVPLVRKSAKVVTVILGIIFVLQNMEVDVGSLIAGVSLGGLAFTLAARDTVANLFGSVSIFADQPFQVGDWVVMQDVEGVVEEVGMRSTRVRTFYKSLVSIPNSKVADGLIDNYGRRSSRRTFLKLGLQYDTTPEQIQAFCDGVRAILHNNPAVSDKDTYHVYFSGFADSALEVMLYFFFVVETWEEELRSRHNVFLEILRLAKELKVRFAFPTQTLHLSTRARETAVAPRPEPGIDELRTGVLAFAPEGALARPEGPEITHGFFLGRIPGEPERRDAGQGDDADADIGDSRE